MSCFVLKLARKKPHLFVYGHAYVVHWHHTICNHFFQELLVIDTYGRFLSWMMMSDACGVLLCFDFASPVYSFLLNRAPWSRKLRDCFSHYFRLIICCWAGVTCDSCNQYFFCSSWLCVHSTCVYGVCAYPSNPVFIDVKAFGGWRCGSVCPKWTLWVVIRSFIIRNFVSIVLIHVKLQILHRSVSLYLIAHTSHRAFSLFASLCVFHVCECVIFETFVFFFFS